MINIDTLTLGNEFKDADGITWKVTSNFSEDKKLMVELTKIRNEVLEELLQD